MRIALIDPFFEDSHRVWAEGLQSHLAEPLDIYSGSAFNWKWKMTGGSVSMAEEVNASGKSYDTFIVTDMLNAPLFKSLLLPEYQDVPFILYFHENQITYPWSPTDEDKVKKRDHHYGFINFCSAIVADRICFNSAYHQESFLGALPTFVNMFPDDDLKGHLESITAKSSVLYIGLDLPKYKQSSKELTVFLWNHRWEYDKNPDFFFQTLFKLKERGVPFELIVLGKSYQKAPAIFGEAKERLSDEIIHWGYAESKTKYFEWLQLANMMMVTSHQDFFGISIVEAIAAGCFPILPNRLSYAEHIDAEEIDQCIYKEDSCLLEQLESVINTKRYQNTKGYSDFVQKYDWENISSVYKDVISSISKD